MSMYPISLFLDESSISKRINMASGLEKIADNSAQKCTWYQKFSSKISKSRHAMRSDMSWIALMIWVVGKVLLSENKYHCNITVK